MFNNCYSFLSSSHSLPRSISLFFVFCYHAKNSSLAHVAKHMRFARTVFPLSPFTGFLAFFITFFFNRKNTSVAAFSENIYYAIIRCRFAISCVYSMQFIPDRSFCESVSMLPVSLTVSSFSRFPIILLFLSLFFKLASLFFHAFSLSLSLSFTFSLSRSYYRAITS